MAHSVMLLVISVMVAQVSLVLCFFAIFLSHSYRMRRVARNFRNVPKNSKVHINFFSCFLFLKGHEFLCLGIFILKIPVAAIAIHTIKDVGEVIQRYRWDQIISAEILTDIGVVASLKLFVGASSAKQKSENYGF